VQFLSVSDKNVPSQKIFQEVQYRPKLYGQKTAKIEMNIEFWFAHLKNGYSKGTV
jgi:hypothetical protein